MSGKSVGVIIPIYNTSKYLDKCLNYIYSQTYQNIKIMLINDGSTDKKVDEVMEDYANYDDYIEANHPTSIENYNLQNKIIISNKI
ncbi:glycosyltransferase family A protein [Campylobacter porcelli]|uniref:Glycosyltransferase family A protein n=1 Tax=Campylobacter porcelli TaxID=1660073 RepID=A0ABU7M6H4_9BACT|nr:glycosyltransferase family A protein [Campylobacter sp. P0124]MEE3745291.1 glycosyltransferase family A protein [Campylobacter sp. CX2-4855-23]